MKKDRRALLIVDSQNYFIVDAFDLGFRPIVLHKFCASRSGPVRHKWALGLLRAIIGKKSVI